MSSRFIKQLLAFLFLAAATTGPVLASTLYLWDRQQITGVDTYAAPFLACNAYKSSLTSGQAYSHYEENSSTWNCGYTANSVRQYLGIATRYSTTCPYGDNSYQCNASCDAPNTMVNGQCIAPPQCPEGSFWDFDSSSCKYPQDDACDSIGASWDPAASACQCDSPTAALVTAAGVTRCMQLRDDSCTKDSPDFKGYATYGDSAGQAVCDGRASCPDGGTPGYVGSGDTMSAVCYSNTPEGSENCDGQAGLQDGVEVCIPNPGDDPDFPDCEGVVGTFNGVKRCIDKPGGHAGCSAGETPGYVGAGDNATFTCIPSDYKPETCPPGQYVTNAATGGFGCATTGGQSKDDVAAGKTPGTGSGTSQTTQKDAAGNVVGTEESEFQIDLTQLTEDTPANNYKDEMDEFSDTTLEGIDTDSIVSSFSGSDGAFTDRSSLNTLSSFVVTHTIGNTTSCNGSLPFFGYTISCEKFATYNRIFGWIIFILTLINIYNIIMSKSESGV